MTAIIRIAAAVILRNDGRMLLVRKRGTDAFMQPGGKYEPGEDALTALRRELEEELGTGIAADFDAEKAHSLGRFSAPAANEPGHIVEADLYLMAAAAEVSIAAEIAEARWVSQDEALALPLAPLTRERILPLIWH